jgi:hypothetical protein
LTEEESMIDEPTWHEIEAQRSRAGYDDETVIIDEDDFEGHGMLGIATAVAIVAGSTGGVMFAQADSALAPEPAVLTQTLTSSYSDAAAYYQSTNVATNVRYVGTSWIYSPTLAVGTPCATYWPVPAGTVTGKVVQAMGNYRRCA